MATKNDDNSLAIRQEHDAVILQITVTAIKVQPNQDSMLLKHYGSLYRWKSSQSSLIVLRITMKLHENW